MCIIVKSTYLEKIKFLLIISVMCVSIHTCKKNSSIRSYDTIHSNAAALHYNKNIKKHFNYTDIYYNTYIVIFVRNVFAFILIIDIVSYQT